MLGLPKTSEVSKRIPKQKFYENLSVSPVLKRVFADQIRAIYWRNKIAPTTMNISPGNIVTEIEIFELRLNVPQLDISVLQQIDKEIPYHIIFFLEYEDKYQIWTAYKEAALSGNNAFKVGTYYHTDWVDESEITLKVDGLNIDVIYENLVRQIAGDSLKSNGSESLKESVERDQKRKELEKKIAKLEVKVRKEKQFNKQVELNRELKKLRKELEEF